MKFALFSAVLVCFISVITSKSILYESLPFVKASGMDGKSAMMDISGLFSKNVGLLPVALPVAGIVEEKDDLLHKTGDILKLAGGIGMAMKLLGKVGHKAEDGIGAVLGVDAIEDSLKNLFMKGEEDVVQIENIKKLVGLLLLKKIASNLVKGAEEKGEMSFIDEGLLGRFIGHRDSLRMFEDDAGLLGLLGGLGNKDNLLEVLMGLNGNNKHGRNLGEVEGLDFLDMVLGGRRGFEDRTLLDAVLNHEEGAFWENESEDKKKLLDAIMTIGVGSAFGKMGEMEVEDKLKLIEKVALLGGGAKALMGAKKESADKTMLFDGLLAFDGVREKEDMDIKKKLLLTILLLAGDDLKQKLLVTEKDGKETILEVLLGGLNAAGKKDMSMISAALKDEENISGLIDGFLGSSALSKGLKGEEKLGGLLEGLLGGSAGLKGLEDVGKALSNKGYLNDMLDMGHPLSFPKLK